MGASKKRGEQSIIFDNPVAIAATSSVVGPKEAEGPLAGYFDVIMPDPLLGEKSWEKAESAFVEEGFKKALEKSKYTLNDIDYIIAGDLLNQGIGSTFGVRPLERPFFGIYGACSNMGEGMGLGAILIDGGFANNVLVGASSHFCAAERQFRFPLSLGTQRPLTSTWTVTGQGAVLLTCENGKQTGEVAADVPVPSVTAFTTGKIIDMGITDANNMGGAMAPAAVDTIIRHFKDTGRDQNYYDLIITGDLGMVGKEIVLDLTSKNGYDITSKYSDCGLEIFDDQSQDTHAGGSGCGCSAVTFAAYLYTKLQRKEMNKILFIPTGALLSPTSTQQGESIPGIAHAVAVENIY